MRLTKITVTNFQGLRHAALALSEPLLLVSGANGAGKSSLLDAISMAFTGEPRRVSKKKDLSQLVTEGTKKGEAHVTWHDSAGEEQVSWVMLPTGKTAPLVDAPFLPFVLDATRFAGLDGKERRRVLFELTGASASPNEIAKRLTDHGADAALVEKIKPMLRAGFPAAADQAKEHAAEARGAWKAITGEAYGSEKANGWEPEAPAVIVAQADIDQAAGELAELDQDLAEAQQTLGGHKAAAQAASLRQAKLDALRETAGLLQRRRDKLAADQARVEEWAPKVTEAERAAAGKPVHDPMTCPHCQGKVELRDGDLVAYAPPELIADPDAGWRLEEYRGYLESARRAVANSQRDVTEAEAAAAQVAVMETEAASIPSAEAIENAERTISEMRQQRDSVRAKHLALQEAAAAHAGRDRIIADAAAHHAAVQAWGLIADALAPDGIPAEILAGALDPVNNLLAIQSAAANWSPVQINPDIDVTYGGRVYGLLSESEKWRCDALLAIAIARLSGLRFVALDRFDVLQPSARPQILGLLRTLTQGGDLDTAILAGTMKEPMAKVPTGIQSVWIAEGSIVASTSQQQAA